jgi:hypothetical protein
MVVRTACLCAWVAKELLSTKRDWAITPRKTRPLFREVKYLFSSAPEVGKETEANGGHIGDRTLDRTRSLYDRTRPVSVQRLHVFQFDDQTRSVSGHCRPDTSGHSGSLLDSNRTLALWRPVSSTARPIAVSLCATQV